MIHVVTAETLSLLEAYYSDRELRQIATFEIRRRKSSRKMSAGRPREHREQAPEGTADFGDAESMRVLDAIADALLEPLALQMARDDDEDEWLASQQGHL